ncbi:MAG: RHS repeat-associated core domain-containing protein [Bdellovibrionota bacterium]|nr:RHS repeat-associated core domain-containing protein [Bdellovibrionota bacterium]
MVHDSFGRARGLGSESGHYYYRARFYNPALGRFLTEDPIGFYSGTQNLQKYVGNNPVLKNDPSGLFDSAFWTTLNLNCSEASKQLGDEIKVATQIYVSTAAVAVGGSTAAFGAGAAAYACAINPASCASFGYNAVDFVDNLGIDNFTTGLPPQTPGGAAGYFINVIITLPRNSPLLNHCEEDNKSCPRKE